MRKYLLLIFTGLLVFSIVGCQEEEPDIVVVRVKKKPDETAAVTQAPTTKPQEKVAAKADDKDGGPRIVSPGFGHKNNDPPMPRRQQPAGGDAMASMGGMGSISSSDPVGSVLADIRDSVKIRKTLAVWVIDEDADNSIRADVCGRVSNLYAGIEKEGPGNLMSAVVGGGSDVEFLTPNATASVEEVQAALTKGGSTKDASKLFTAVAAAADKLLGLAGQDKRDVFFVVISKNGGGDIDKLEPAIDALKKYPPNTLTFYAVTHSTPFGPGRNAFSKEEGKVPSATLYPETISIESWMGGKSESDFGSSGFGPWSVCRMASAMKPGKVVLMDSLSPETKAMEKFKPDYVSVKDYEQLMNSNKARKALHEAAKLPFVKVLGNAGQLNFSRPDPSNSNAQAGFVTMISKVQRNAADVLKDQERLSEILLGGEGDYKALPPRLKAEFSIALAKCLLNRARADGYDSLLAAIKQGKPFKDAAHNRWVLEPDIECKELSNIDGWCKKSRKHLQEVVNECPGTPWAQMAAAELDKQYGWKIMEQ